MARLLDMKRFNAAGMVAGVGCLMLGAALAFQHLGDLAPCALCIDQRKAWGVAIVLACLALWADGRSRIAVAVALLALAALAVLAGAGIAGFHVGVEQKWWTGTAECGAGFSGFGSGDAAALREQLLARPVVRCDQVAWSFLGVSMAGWNGLVALAAGGLALYVAGRDMRRMAAA